MTKAEMIAGLKAGRTLMQDGWATEEEKQAVRELRHAGVVTMKIVQGDQYSAWKIRWVPGAELVEPKS